MNDTKNKKVFLVDSENISDYSFLNKYDLSSHDKIVIFASKNSKSIKLEFVETLFNIKDRVSFEWVNTGSPNELDIQLIAYLAMNILNEHQDFYIVSNDSGYQSPINYIMSKVPFANISLLTTLNHKSPLPNTDSNTKKADLTKKVLSELEVIKNKQIRKEVTKIIQDNLNSNSQLNKINNSINSCVGRLRLGKAMRKSICQAIMVPVTTLSKEINAGNITPNIKLV